MVRLHHVNLSVYEDGIDAQAEFLVDVLGMHRIDPGPELRGLANWFEDDSGTQVHLSKDPDHRPAAKAHVAVELGDELPLIEKRLVAAGIDSETRDALGLRVVLCRDPAGNMWELRGEALA